MDLPTFSYLRTMIQIKSFTFNLLGTNCFVVWDDSQRGCIICDPGMYRDFETAALGDFIAAERLTPEAVMLTHGHFDHIWSAAATARRYNCPVYMSPADKDTAKLGLALFDRIDFKKEVELFDSIPVEDGQSLHLGGVDWKVLSTPGHSPGGVCYYAESGRLLLSGDTLLAGTIGRSSTRITVSFDPLHLMRLPVPCSSNIPSMVTSSFPLLGYSPA